MPIGPLQLVVVLQVAGEPVGAEEEGVAGEHLENERVHLDPLVHPDGAGDGVLVPELLDVLARHAPALDQLVDDGVILGDLLHLAFAHHVDAAVADVGDEGLVPEHEQRRERGAHAALGVVGKRFLVDAGAGAVHRVLHQVDDVPPR